MRHLETYGTIISKAEAAKIFSFTRSAWDSYATHITQPEGWKISLTRDDAGTLVTTSDPDTGRILSIQPRFRDQTHTLDRLVISSHYPIGAMPSFPPELKKIEQSAQKTLGSRYSVSASYSKSASLESVDLTLTLADTASSPERTREDRTLFLANDVLASGSEHTASHPIERGAGDAYRFEGGVTGVAAAISPKSTAVLNCESGHLKTFNVYRHPVKGYEAVKVGFSWPALLLSPCWMFVKQLWGISGLWVGVLVVLSLIEAVADKSQPSPERAIISLLSSVGYFATVVVPGLKGNRWREKNLSRRGFALLGTVRAATPSIAISHATKMSAGIVPQDTLSPDKTTAGR